MRWRSGRAPPRPAPAPRCASRPRPPAAFRAPLRPLPPTPCRSASRMLMLTCQHFYLDMSIHSGAVPSSPGLGAAAHERIRRAIVRLELAPGSPVSEAQLVARFGFSKAAVRAALARLRVEGLVMAEPRRGHVIAPVTLRDIREIYDLRLLLEPPAARAAAGVIDLEEIARLKALTEPVPDLDDPASVDRFMQANRAIHIAVAQAAGNRRAAAIIARLLDDGERARLL